MSRWIRWAAAVLATLVAVSDSRASEQWAREMFAVTAHDFGTVARGSDPTFNFVFTNKYRETVHVSAIRSSCGCTTPRVLKDTLKEGETGAIQAAFNTTSFTGAKAATLTVVFDKPFFAEVRLQVSGVILSDVQFDPPEIAFGEVAEGQEAERKIKVSFSGHPHLKIQDVRSQFTHFRVRLGERRQQGTDVEYSMTVSVKPTAPQGDINERLTLVTNDPRVRTVVVAASGRVRAPVEVRPQSVHVGTVAAGKSASERLLVRADEPFEITEVVCTDPRITCEIPKGAKKVHFVKLTFTGDKSASGSFRIPVRIQTNLPKDAEAVCTVTGEAPEK